MEPLGLLHSGGWVSYAITRTNTCTQTHKWPCGTVHKHWTLHKKGCAHTRATNFRSKSVSCAQDLGVHGQIQEQGV